MYDASLLLGTLSSLAQLGTVYCQPAVFIMTSNLGSEDIRVASPMLHEIIAKTEGQHEHFLRFMGQFNRQLYPLLKESLKRDEFLGRINETVIFLPFNDQEVSHESYREYSSLNFLLSVDKSNR
jgi:ATP-dependent Clp protease ATP-binding subunit ClpB